MPLARIKDKSRCALLVIDMQNDFCSLEGNMAKIGRDISFIQKMIPNLSRLLGICRSIGIGVIFTKMVHSVWTDSPAWIAKLNSKNVRHGTWGCEFYQGFEPHEEDWVVEKHRYSAFLNTDLDTVLRARGIDTVIVTGVNSDQCVDGTAKHAFQLDYYVYLVKDCIATDSQTLTETVLTMAEKSYAWIVSSAEIIEMLRKKEAYQE
jgi:ureidoacrylate peracid hydrolase